MDTVTLHLLLMSSILAFGCGAPKGNINKAGQLPGTGNSQTQVNLEDAKINIGPADYLTIGKNLQLVYRVQNKWYLHAKSKIELGNDVIEGKLIFPVSESRRWLIGENSIELSEGTSAQSKVALSLKAGEGALSAVKVLAMHEVALLAYSPARKKILRISNEGSHIELKSGIVAGEILTELGDGFLTGLFDPDQPDRFFSLAKTLPCIPSI